MDNDARDSFAWHVEAMSRSASQFELCEHRRAADEIARQHRQTFDEALRDYRAGWPEAGDDEDHGIGGAETPPTAVPGDDDDDDEEDRLYLKSAQMRSSEDAWTDPIGLFVADRETATIGEIATTVLGLTGRLATTDRLRISGCLERLGWRREKKNWRGQIEWRRATTDHFETQAC